MIREEWEALERKEREEEEKRGRARREKEVGFIPKWSYTTCCYVHPGKKKYAILLLLWQHTNDQMKGIGEEKLHRIWVHECQPSNMQQLRS